ARFIQFGPRQEHFCLDTHQRGSHYNKFTGKLHVECLHLLAIIEEIVGNPRNGYIVDIEVVAFDKKQQQIKWTLKLGQSYFVAFRLHTGSKVSIWRITCCTLLRQAPKQSLLLLVSLLLDDPHTAIQFTPCGINNY